MGVFWILCSVLLNLQMQSTIGKYGSEVHDRVKTMLVALITLPLCIGSKVKLGAEEIIMYMV